MHRLFLREGLAEQHFKKRKRALLRDEMRESIKVFPHASGSNQSRSPEEQSGSEHLEHPEQEQGSNIPESASPRIRQNIGLGTMQDRHGFDLPEIFQCSLCDRHFKTRLHRDAHEKQHRPNLPNYICDKSGCDRTYRSKGGLERHIQSVSQVSKSEDFLMISADAFEAEAICLWRLREGILSSGLPAAVSSFR